MVRALLFSRDIVAALLLLIVGTTVVVLSLHYQLGSPAQMGPGFFPLLAGGLIVVFGAVIAARALIAAPTAAPLPGFAAKPVLGTLASIVLFGLVIGGGGGLALSVFLLSLAASASGHDFRVLPSIVLAAALAAVSVLIFVVGLRLPMPILPAL